MDARLEINRSCGTCTKCCEGYLPGTAHGHDFYPGKPCHFVTKGKGCSIYENRPEHPCRSFECMWIINPDMPAWLKPDLADVVVTRHEKSGISYWCVTECGKTIQSNVLSWFFTYANRNLINLVWQCEGGWNAIGTSDFLDMWNRPIDA